MSRKLILTFLLISQFLLVPTFLVSSDFGGLSIDTDTLEQRGNTSSQVTARLRIDILTADSAERQDRAQETRDQRLDESVSSLFSGNAEKEAAYQSYVAEKLFQNPKTYLRTDGTEEKGVDYSTLIVVMSALAVAAISYFATLVYRNRKRDG